ncbi:SAM-dependent chlorinase/fluorinase [Persicimonas caeni]|uniref:SAM-dependent chlorinase/fluorinase n=1 Tax=Persicimonas caeni TaxID=2292766 RepID=A0A4Y6PYH3_PERCE|nr:SAM-dependent chlorinase/fluorinase [Persicimonas caeni]QDG53303.1 SAM-dependent chlorinase/fluorinase [Persicimonas caeni]QED34525.1 SAM-dependent chlorinase/fluorinase [Persicimonas caeni]
MNTPTVALLTDFGLKDNYVGIMKAVIDGICPGVQLVDLCHEVPPQNLLSGAYLLSSAAPYLKEGTILMGVVDPGVGSTRRSVAIDTGSFVCVGPDNGLFDMVLKKYSPNRVVVLDNPEFHLPKVSATFHGRDIFAPVSGHLAAGANLETLGTHLDPADLVRLPPSAPFLHNERIECHVIHVDRFGNLITNLSDRELTDWLDGARPRIDLDGERVPLMKTFASVPKRRPLAYFGSSGQLEIAVRDGSAARHFGAAQGQTVGVEKE